MHFRTFGVSAPRFELEGLRFVTVKSRALGQRADLTLASVPGTPEMTGQPLVIWNFPGGHAWPYWETHLEESLRFFARHLRPPASQPSNPRG
jgi:hypothetical protein